MHSTRYYRRRRTADCDPGMEPYWAAKYFPNHAKTVRIIYLMSYYKDCGSGDGSWVNTLLQWVGIAISMNGWARTRT